MYEDRTNQTISPDIFSHIQVPLKNFEQAQNYIKDLKLDLPIIPIEFAELISSNTPVVEHLVAN